MSNDIIETDNPVTDDDLERLGNATRSTNDFIGRPLKFTKGEWRILTGKDTPPIEIDTAERFIVDARSYASGIVKWIDQKPVERHIYRAVDGWILPSKERWPDRDEDRWPWSNKAGRTVDPWQENHQVVLKRLERDEGDDGLVTWTSTSIFGIKRMQKFINKDFVHDARKHPGMMPVVTLGTSDEISPAYGRIPSPLLTIIDWQPFGEGASPRGSRDAVPHSAAMLMLGRPPDDGGEVVEAETVETKTLPRRHDADMDDEIPF